MKNIKFTKAKWLLDEKGTWLSILVENPIEARKLVSEIKDKPYIAQIKEYREKRSLDANAYAWTLINKLAFKLRITPEDVYRQHIKDVANNYEQLCLKDTAIETFNRMWSLNGTGWLTDVISPCRTQEGYSWVNAYYGSSEFNTEQMSRFIGFIVDDCKEQNIETLTPDEIARLGELWHTSEQKH